MVITLCQLDIIWGNPEANRRKAETFLAAAPQGDIFLLPETFTTGFGNHMASFAEPAEGPTLQWARGMASRFGTMIVGTWVVAEDGCCYNRLHWVYPSGEYGFYDKAHTFRVSGEADQIARGKHKAVFEWQGWRIKPAVCYDLRFPKWLRNDAMSYDLLLVCANWPGSRHEAWTTLLKARAIENLAFAVGCNRTGTDQEGIGYTGNSLFVDYKGLPMAELEGEQTRTLELDKGKLQTFRSHWPFYLDFD